MFVCSNLFVHVQRLRRLACASASVPNALLSAVRVCCVLLERARIVIFPKPSEVISHTASAATERVVIRADPLPCVRESVKKVAPPP